MHRQAVAIVSLAFIVATYPAASLASDHADPIFNSHPDGGLTGLFVFPSGGASALVETGESDDAAADSADLDRQGVGGSPDDGADGGVDDAATTPAPDDELIFILGIHPSLSTSGPYDLDRFRYHIHIDTHSEVTFLDPADLARYGGTILHPAGISADISMNFRLDNQAQLVESQIVGMDSAQLEMVSGVYDDPFIFPRFFGKNIVAIAIRVPYSELPAGRQDFVIWGNTTEAKSGDQVDHVGRSNRTQLPRFDFLNTLQPSQHVEAIHDEAHKVARIRNFAKRFPPPALYQSIDLLFSIRYYDYVPDVMIFSFRNPPGFPNGRRLPDDVVALTCEVGECLLEETSFSESQAWPRITTNDRPFAAEFPFLAPPWPDQEPMSQPGCFWPVFLILIVVALLAWLFFKVVCKLCRWRTRKSESTA